MAGSTGEAAGASATGTSAVWWGGTGVWSSASTSWSGGIGESSSTCGTEGETVWDVCASDSSIVKASDTPGPKTVVRACWKGALSWDWKILRVSSLGTAIRRTVPTKAWGCARFTKPRRRWETSGFACRMLMTCSQRSWSCVCSAFISDSPRKDDKDMYRFYRRLYTW